MYFPHLTAVDCVFAAMRKLAVCLAVVAYLITTLGMPLPVPGIAATGSPEFACKGRGCGCATAEQCRKSCCCFKPRSGCAKCTEPAQAPDDTVVGIRALQCGGISTEWVISGGVVLPPTNIACPISSPPSEYLESCDEQFHFLANSPPTPPPRSTQRVVLTQS